MNLKTNKGKHIDIEVLDVVDIDGTLYFAYSLEEHLQTIVVCNNGVSIDLSTDEVFFTKVGNIKHNKEYVKNFPAYQPLINKLLKNESDKKNT